MKVVATKLGYYNLLRRREGDVFHLEKSNDFRESWMEKLEAPVQVKQDVKVEKESLEFEDSSDDDVL